jgi:5-carboxymethyl-2-hydroxymuconate isomerase
MCVPHCIVEYSDNIEDEGGIPELLQKIAAKFRTGRHHFPEGGVRVRAWPVHEYVIADGDPRHAFVNVTVRIGAGRPPDFLRAFFDETFDIVVDHFRIVSERRGLGITMYLEIADPEGSWKTNSIHAHMKKALV